MPKAAQEPVQPCSIPVIFDIDELFNARLTHVGRRLAGFLTRVSRETIIHNERLLRGALTIVQLR